jgi:CubicO group peptidase (beta-lactamase class C family)
MSDVEIHGTCDSRFASVRDAFEKNFKQGHELGAAFAVALEGEVVVDLWGGYADVARTRPWLEDTVVAIASTAKIANSLCGLMLVDRGLIELDAPVARYWPEFAAAGKTAVTVRQIFCHSSGVAGFDPPIRWEDLSDWDAAVAKLAAQAPWWEPGTASGYHGMTYPFLIGELVRRTTGMAPDEFFREEVASKIGADFHFGLPTAVSPRCAEVDRGTPRAFDDGSMAYRAIGVFMADGPPDHSDLRRLNIAAGYANARSLVKVGSVLANGGSLYGHEFLSPETIRLAHTEQIYVKDLVMGVPVRFGLGFGLASKEIPLPFPNSFHWGGYGGSMMVMEPDSRSCWSYVPNLFDSSMAVDDRGLRVSIATIQGVQGLGG